MLSQGLRMSQSPYLFSFTWRSEAPCGLRAQGPPRGSHLQDRVHTPRSGERLVFLPPHRAQAPLVSTSMEHVLLPAPHLWELRKGT